jgi:hypothetical protein
VVDVKNKENSRLRASYWFWAEEKLETTRVFGDTEYAINRLGSAIRNEPIFSVSVF